MRKIAYGVGLLIALLATITILFWTPDLDKTLLEEKYTNAASDFAVLPSGTRAHYRLYGDTSLPRLVLLHGSNASLHTWEPLVDRLKDGFHILTIDLPGHGLTGPTLRDEYSRDEMTDMVRELTQSLGFAPFSLAGNSMGGAVSLTYALKHPDDLSHLVLLDASGVSADTPDGSKPSLPLAFKLAGTWYGDLVLGNVTPRSLVVDGLKSSTTVQSIITDDMIDRYHDLARYPGARLATSKRFQGYRATRGDIDVARITIPSLLIWGEYDGLIPLAAGEKMDSLMPNSRLEVLKDTGHLPMEERPDETARLMRDFLTQEDLD